MLVGIHCLRVIRAVISVYVNATKRSQRNGQRDIGSRFRYRPPKTYSF
ncbi:hypothetical protein CFBP1590__5320 [Pseudomonas viridiflava]|uniref:Uncharacterized protein n=1 Tax=Pseudomonas viridiflava TaxID=33069 RepID=A0A1Y6JSI4_PSEVI|nr:hypothetical protein CFBP1590__5320 [Pseudomonas viridiflava]VVM47858.1 hypothetical protein PS634_00653 [Pseudomonas fluorescens]VVO36986.1 hypothetical protein PS689_05471 [Pseudomonas fluorescens]